MRRTGGHGWTPRACAKQGLHSAMRRMRRTGGHGWTPWGDGERAGDRPRKRSLSDRLLNIVWRNIRIAILLLVLIWAAGHTWLERITSTGWKEPLWVGIFPVNADGSPAAESYIEGLGDREFTDVEDFIAREAHRYGKELEQPVHVALYPQVKQTPPELERGAGVLDTALWSLKLRWFAWRAVDVRGRAPPRIRMFVLYHDPANLHRVPDSHGMQKGLTGVVHAFALRSMAGGNSIVVAHELLHTLGATDKYEPGSGLPLFPAGFAEPERQPLYPQDKAEIMAGRRAVSAQDAEMPVSLGSVVVGPATAAEIRWTRQ